MILACRCLDLLNEPQYEYLSNHGIRQWRNQGFSQRKNFSV